jgi:uncharacterized protein YciI
MKAVIFYETNSSATMDRIMEVYPRHKQLVDDFSSEKKIIAIGTFANPAEGAMGVFVDKTTAEEFVGQDPFVNEGIVSKVTIKEWNEILL